MKKSLFRAWGIVSALTVGLALYAVSAQAEIVGATGASGNASANQPQQKEIGDAVEKFKNRDFDGALKILEEATKKNPDFPPAHLIMAQLFGQAGVSAGVLNSLQAAVKEHPEDPEAYMILADNDLREGRLAEADLLFAKANEVLAQYSKSQKRKADLTLRGIAGVASVAASRGNWPVAQKKLEELLKLRPNDPQALQSLAQVMFQQKDAQGALTKLREAQKADPKILTPEATLAGFYLSFGDKENAKKWMDAALKAAAQDLATQIAAGKMAIALGQIEEAKARAAAASQIDAKSLDALLLTGIVALYQKDYPAAEKAFESAHLQAPGAFAFSNNLALALAEQSDETKKQRAAQYAENNARQYPKQAEALSTYGWVLYKIGRVEDADNTLRQALLASPQQDPDTVYYASKVASERGRVEEATKWLEAALKSTTPFTKRADAQALLEQLKK